MASQTTFREFALALLQAGIDVPSRIQAALDYVSTSMCSLFPVEAKGMMMNGVILNNVLFIVNFTSTSCGRLKTVSLPWSSPSSSLPFQFRFFLQIPLLTEPNDA